MQVTQNLTECITSDFKNIWQKCVLDKKSVSGEWAWIILEQFKDRESWFCSTFYVGFEYFFI